MTGVKNQEALLHLFALLSKSVETRLRFIGPDYADGRIHQLARTMGVADRIEFLGRLEHRDLPRHYQWAHLLLHTSYYEGQGLVIAEAAASGAIPCGSRVGLLADLDGSCTVTTPSGNVEELAKMVLDLLHDDGRMAQLRENGRNWAEKHDIEWTVSRFAELYRELVPEIGGGCD
jgi:glycosyltransferase involved in cell wall biosynthesis